PAVREELHGQAREVRVLISEQPPHQIRRHVDLGGRHPVHSHDGRQRQANTGCSKWATRVTRPCSASWQNWWMTAAVGAYTWPPSSARRRTSAGDSGMRRSLGGWSKSACGITWIRATSDDCRTSVPTGPP